MVTAGTGGAIVGRGGDLLLIDDPHKNWEKANSELYTQRLIEWFNSTFYTRAEPGASIVIIMQRWSELDLTQYLTEQHSDDWIVIRFPAICEDAKDVLGRRRGDALCPERFDVDQLASIRKGVSHVFWNGLFQQRPSTPEGNIIKRQWFRFWHHPGQPLPAVKVTLPDNSHYYCPTTEIPPAFDSQTQSWDMAFKAKSSSSYVVGEVWGKARADRYLLDLVRRRMDFGQTIRAVKSLSSLWPLAYCKLIEDAANGPAVIEALRKELSGINAVSPVGSKESRVHAVSPIVSAGNVYLPHPSLAEWVGTFIDECADFPNARYNDQVDAMSQFLIYAESGAWIAGITPISFASPSHWRF